MPNTPMKLRSIGMRGSNAGWSTGCGRGVGHAADATRRPPSGTLAPKNAADRQEATVRRERDVVDSRDGDGSVGADELPLEPHLVVVLIDRTRAPELVAGELPPHRFDHRRDLVDAADIAQRIAVAAVGHECLLDQGDALRPRRLRSTRRRNDRQPSGVCRSGHRTRWPSFVSTGRREHPGSGRRESMTCDVSVTVRRSLRKA